MGEAHEPGETITPRPARTLALLLLALGLLLRLPSIELPVDGEGAALATRAALMAAEEGFKTPETRHQGPLMPMILAVPVSSGATPTGALRWTDLILGACLGPLAYGVARRLRRQHATAAWVGLLVAVHPLLLLVAGGPTPSADGLTAVLLLLVIGGLLRPGRRAGRSAALGTLLLPLADPIALVYVPGFLLVYAAKERSPRARIVVGAGALLALLLAPVPVDGSWGTASTPVVRLGALLVCWAPLAGLLFLLPVLPRGAARLLTGPAEGRSVTRAWAVGTVLHAAVLLLLPVARPFGFNEAGLGAAAWATPALVLAGVVGTAALLNPWRRRLRRGAMTVAVLAGVVLAWGWLHAAVVPGAGGAAGRLHELGRALRAAEHEAGPTGRLALDLPGFDGPTVARAVDRVDVGRIGTCPAVVGDGDTVLPPSVVESLGPAEPIVLLTRATSTIPRVATGGGVGIFVQEPISRHGPWMLLRLRRP